jgi:aminopeptidase N
MPLVLVAVLAVPAAFVVWLLPALRIPANITTPASQNPGSTDGAPGLGDPYYPQAGNSGYDVVRYQIMINWDPTSQSMTSVTTISARATQQLNSFYYDLALHTDGVQVNGQPATFAQQGFSDVYVRPAVPIASGSPFQVVVNYSGKPGELEQGSVRPWWTTNGEWTAAGEPESSAWWFPANDHPSDPALMDVSIRVPAGMEAISVGRLVSADDGNEADYDTWHWISRQPMATFLNFVSIGQYEISQGVDHGLPYVYAVSEQLPAQQRKVAFAALLTSGQRVRTLQTMFGPYPFTELGGVVPAHKLWFGGLETQTRPIYNASSILNTGFAPTLITHELAHMWFGDNVTVRQWNDIVDSEGYASWAEWGYVERTGGRSATEAMNETYESYRGRPGFWRITMIDPTKDHLFDAVYARGPMMLQGLRNVIGDDAFFALARDWSQDPGSRSLEDWMATAQSETTVDLSSFFQAWIYARTAPERTAANGFR